MLNLLSLNEIFSNGYKTEVLDLLYIDSILCGILVIVSKNPIVSVLFLIGLFLSISSYLIILGLNFIGLSYLLVYVGAVSILFLFILMLINIRISELLNDTSNSLFLAIFISIILNYIINKILPKEVYYLDFNANLQWYTGFLDIFKNIMVDINHYWVNLFSYYSVSDVYYLLDNTLSNSNEVYFVTSKIWDGNLSEINHITSIGNIMYTSYSIWLIITSVILLLAMVGSIVITIKNDKK
jgi:NADH-ubiquinone oxidoreductase chain 6